MSIDGRAGDAELLGDLLDGVLAFAVVTGSLIHLPRQLYLARPQFRHLPPVRLPALAAASLLTAEPALGLGNLHPSAVCEAV